MKRGPCSALVSSVKRHLSTSWLIGPVSIVTRWPVCRLPPVSGRTASIALRVPVPRLLRRWQCLPRIILHLRRTFVENIFEHAIRLAALFALDRLRRSRSWGASLIDSLWVRNAGVLLLRLVVPLGAIFELGYDTTSPTVALMQSRDMKRQVSKHVIVVVARG